MNKLKPCPFCGGEADIKERYINGVANKKAYWAECKICRSRSYDRNSRTKSIEIWNTRTDGWIPVSERLPEEETSTLVSFANGSVTTMFYYDEAFLWGRDEDIVAWQPLPKAYEEKEGAE